MEYLILEAFLISGNNLQIMNLFCVLDATKVVHLTSSSVTSLRPQPVM